MGVIVKCDVNVTQPCLDVEVFSEEEPFSLSRCPTTAKKENARTTSSAWVSQTMKEIQHFVGPTRVSSYLF